MNRAKKYVSSEGWEVIDIFNRFIASRDLYESDNEAKESLECFDKAIRNKISAIFYIFSSENNDDKDA